jgi:hypothetical protein
LVQVPWEAKPSEEFVREAARMCETSQAIHVEYLALFLSRWYDEGAGKDRERTAHFAEIAKTRASSDRVRMEAGKVLSRKQPPPAPQAIPKKEVKPEIQQAAAELLSRFAASVTAGRLAECAPMLSEDFRYNGSADKTRTLTIFEDDVGENPGVALSVQVDSVSSGPTDNEVEASGRLVAVMPGREVEEQTIRWVLRAEGPKWVIVRWDRMSEQARRLSPP